MKKIRKRFLFLFIFGCIVVAGIQLYVNSLDKKYRFGMTRNAQGTFNANDLRRFTDLRPARLRPQKFKKINFKNKYDVLLTCSFDTLTEWPSKEKMPEKFDPDEILEIGRDPGLGIRDLHKQGITGKGVRAAIIDLSFLREHEEYRDKVKKFCLANGKSLDTIRKPAMHGTATASLLVGERSGTAPGASLYFWRIESDQDKFNTDRAAAIEQIMAFNKDKKMADRIRIVSISSALRKKFKNHEKFAKALKLAKKSGLTVVLVNRKICGINCPLYKDRNNPANYNIMYYFQGYEKELPGGAIYVPCDNRTTASERGEKEYSFWGDGGYSWAVPYLAGVIALGYQVNPDLETDEVFQYIRDTGTPFNRGWIINPKKFIEKIKKVSKI
jgi:hypothetical protein